MGKRLIVAAVVALLLGGFSVVRAGSLEPPGPPAPTMKPLSQIEPRTPIRAADLPLTITQRGSYYLTESITTAGDGITIAATSVTIDLMGFSLNSTNSSPQRGISAAPYTYNIVIKNGTLSNWGGGAISFDSTVVGTQIINVSARTSSSIGVPTIQAGTSALVANCTTRGGAGHGISAGPGSLIRDSVSFDAQGTGIVADGATVIGCTVRGAETGIYAMNKSTILNCDIDGRIRVESGCTIRGCTVSSSVSSVGAIEASDANVITHNHVTVPAFVGDGLGINISGSSNEVTDNYVRLEGAPGSVGILIWNAGNSVFHNSVTGIGTHYSIQAGNMAGPVCTSLSETPGHVVSPWCNLSF